MLKISNKIASVTLCSNSPTYKAEVEVAVGAAGTLGVEPLTVLGAGVVAFDVAGGGLLT